MPDTAEAILEELNTPKRAYEDMDTFGLYPNGNKVTESPKILFARMDFDTLAKRENVNFSHIFQQSLKDYLGVGDNPAKHVLA